MKTYAIRDLKRSEVDPAKGKQRVGGLELKIRHSGHDDP